jgi:hypothetical protein
MNVPNKLESLFLASLPNLAYCLQARPGAYPRIEHMKNSCLGYAWKNYTWLEMFPRGKYTN